MILYGEFTELSGTSYASAIAAGYFALYLEKNPDATIDTLQVDLQEVDNDYMKLL